MKIPPIKSKITQAIKTRKSRNEEKFLNRYVKINNNLPSGDYFQHLTTARKTLANYAEAKGIQIEITNALDILGEPENLMFENMLKGKLNVKVTDLFTDENTQRVVNTDTKRTYVHSINKDVLVHHSDFEADAPFGTHSAHEDSFLRHLYRNIEQMTNSFRNRT